MRAINDTSIDGIEIFLSEYGRDSDCAVYDIEFTSIDNPSKNLLTLSFDNEQDGKDCFNAILKANRAQDI